MKKYIILLSISLMIILAASIRVNAEETATSEAPMTIIELPEDVYEYDYYICFNGFFGCGGQSSLSDTYIGYADNLLIVFNAKEGYDNFCFYASYGGAVLDAYKPLIPYCGLFDDDVSLEYDAYGYIFEFLTDYAEDIKILSGSAKYFRASSYTVGADDNTIYTINSSSGYSSVSGKFIPYCSLYDKAFLKNYLTSFAKSSIKSDINSDFKDFLNVVYPNGYNADNMSQFENQIRTNIPIFDVFSYAEQYALGDMTEGWMLTTCWNKGDVIATPTILRDENVANITGVDKALTSTGDEYVLGLYIDDINKYTEMDFKYSISYYSNDKSLIGSWGDEDLGYIFANEPTDEYWYNVELRKTVENAGFTYDLENYYFEGLVTIQFREEMNYTTYTYSQIYKINFIVNSSGLTVDTKYVTVGSNGNANTSTDKDWYIGSGSGMGDVIDTSGPSSSGGSFDIGNIIFSSVEILTDTANLVGEFPMLMASVFTFIPLEIFALMVLALILGIVIFLYKRFT